jgi:hypothetical protein
LKSKEDDVEGDDMCYESETQSLLNETTSPQCCKATILIVDDNMFNLIPLELLLKVKFNIDVDMAMTGLEAVEMFKSN